MRAAMESAFADGSWGRYHGPHCERLVETIITLHGVEHALVCSSGTFAVELALRALKIGDGDEVILAAYDFSGNFRSIEAVGARPVLVDIDPETWCLDARLVEQAISPQTRAIIVSHLHGGVANMAEICRVAQEYGLFVVEDACQAPAAIVDRRVAGSWGDVGVLSFGGSKLLTSGRGGAIFTRHADVLQRAKIFCERGNNAFPLSELQASVLLPQFSKLSERNKRRAQSVARLQTACRNLPALKPLTNTTTDNRPCYYKVPWLFEPASCKGHTRESLIAAISAEGVAIDAGFRGFVRRARRRCRKGSDLSHSQHAAENTILLHHPVLLEADETIDRVAEAITKVTIAFAGQNETRQT